MLFLFLAVFLADHGILIFRLAYMHYIAQTPNNLQAYGLCAKDTSVALRLGNGVDVPAQGDFSGGWLPGSDVGRYTT